MRRRVFLTAALAALPGFAFAQTTAPRPRPPVITPENELERAFLAATANAEQRVAFRREFLASQVAVALASDAAESPPREVELREGVRAAAVFTSTSRLSGVMGPAVPRRVMTGRQALTLVIGKNLVLNYRLAPSLVLEPEDVAAWLQDGQ